VPRRAPSRAKERPPAERIVHFVRHGEYVNGPDSEGALTPRGRRQALLLAAHFRGLTIDCIRSSDVVRAQETADILAKRLRAGRVTRHKLLREMLPAPVPTLKVPAHKRADAKRRLNQIVRRFLRSSRETRHEIFVCHGNLIRALLLQVAVGRATGFHRLRIHHGGITTFAVTSTGRIDIVAFNHVGHVPVRSRTYA